ncbi:hypothetical protein N7462_004318 [Penicillium macrosclerotiorum]|uniref:uncharacterized protein n=1 Tax=Penicillium macrosclerotiorum TaxID=303699 RepID=UPI00254661C5|nr:uncharacterized protein N7462_004318 [Penicillium macrosclerotiorum]KAJ5689926.1 hypothetical protein N7462_004318 [Penicillium macrosclerotiorum]
MMRPGLDKPGALPLLVLAVLSLLTLAPSLASFYNIKLTDWTYHISGAPQVPLIQEGADFPPAGLPIEPQKSWIMSAQYRTRGNRAPRSSRAGSGVPTIPSEIAPVENKSRLFHAATESTMFGRRARAFRTYFARHFDDYQFLTPFSNRSLLTTPTNLPPTITPSSASPFPTSIDGKHIPDIPPQNYPPTSSSPPKEDLGLQLPFLCNMWQQACRQTIDLWDLALGSPFMARVTPLVSWGSSYLESVLCVQNTTLEQSSPLKAISKDNSHAADSNLDTLPCAQQSNTAPSDDATDAASRHAVELRGSCMAVVIGLVAGIMWF